MKLHSRRIELSALMAAIVDEYRRATAAARRHEELSRQPATEFAQPGQRRAAVARRVFDEFYAREVWSSRLSSQATQESTSTEPSPFSTGSLLTRFFASLFFTRSRIRR